MKTREVIKDAARKLYNSQGLAAVTLRDIAQSLQRSYGNITYHFASKDQLVEALYADMVAALAEISSGFAAAPSPLHSILVAPQQTFAISMHYLFLYRDYLEIIHHYPALADKVQQANASRKVGIRALMAVLRSQGLLRAALEDADLDYLLELSGAMRTFFFLQLRSTDLARPSLEADYVTYVNRLLYPYLSERGQAIYHEVLGQ